LLDNYKLELDNLKITLGKTQMGKAIQYSIQYNTIHTDFVGMETSHSVLCQAFFDFLHEPDLQKRLQDEIDSLFDSTHVIMLKDR